MGIYPFSVQSCLKQGSGVRLRMWVNGDLVADRTDTANPLPAEKAGFVVNRQEVGGGGDACVI